MSEHGVPELCRLEYWSSGEGERMNTTSTHQRRVAALLGFIVGPIIWVGLMTLGYALGIRPTFSEVLLVIVVGFVSNVVGAIVREVLR